MLTEPEAAAKIGTHDLLCLCHQVVDCSPLPMAAVAGERHILQYVNLSFCLLMGKRSDELVGTPFTEAVLEGETYLPLLDRVYRTREPQLRAKLQIPERCGGWWACTMWPILNAGGQAAGVMIQVSDPVETSPSSLLLTEMNQELLRGAMRQQEFTEAAETLNAQLQGEIGVRERTQIELSTALDSVRLARGIAEEASLAKGLFLTSMSHELRTPLNAIIGYSEMLQEEMQETLNPSLYRDLAIIRGAGMQLLELINGLLDISKIEAGKMTLNLQWFCVNGLLNTVADQARPLTDRNANVLTTVFPDDLGLMYADETKLRQILLNLVSNAAKFTTKGVITLEAALEKGADDVMVFRVKDSGVGISAEEIEKVFAPFYQIQKMPGVKVQQGTGLGLTLTRQFCSHLGGTIELESELGRGSLFTVRLPVQFPDGNEDAESATLAAEDCM